MNKRKSILAHKLVCLSQLLLENLDELDPSTQRMKDLKNTLTEFCEELNEELKDTEAVLKHTYFNDISKKIDTILRVNFNPNM